MLRRSLNILFSKTLSTFPSRSIFQTETLLLPISPKPSFRNVSVHSVRRFSKTSSPSTRNPLSRQDHVHWNWIPWWFWNQNGLYHELKTIGSRLRYQALESYGLWNGPLINSLRGTLWPAERWLLVTGVLRNSWNWVPSFAAGVMRSDRWLCVAMVTSLNTVGAHIPRMTLLLLAQFLARAGNADSVSRDVYFPMTTQSDVILSRSAWNALWIGFWNELKIWMRLCRLALYFLPLFLTYPLTLLHNDLWKSWLRWMRYTLESCGPAFIKWGQWASTRRDLFPLDVSNELRKLQTESPAHTAETSKRAIRSAFGFPVDAIFDDFEDKPIASGSIGQIHKARLSPMGAAMTGNAEKTQVAVKVRHPNVDIAFERDMKLMLWIADCIDRSAILSGFNLHEIICQFATPMAEQVDLCVEAANLQVFRHNFRNNARVLFPEPLFPLVSSDILVETFHTGVCIQDMIEDLKTKETELAELGSATFFDMVVQHNLLHADLHPGNILVQYSNPKSKTDKLFRRLSEQTSRVMHSDRWNPFRYLLKRLEHEKEPSPHIILLDAGMATQLTNKERYHMLGLFRSVAEMDGNAATEHTLSFSGARQTCPDPEAFRKAMLHHFEVVRHPNWSESDFTTSVDAFGHVIDIIRENKVSLPGQIVSCLFTVFLLEGWASKLDPDHSIMEQIKRLVEKVDRSFEKRIKEGANQILINGLSNLSAEVATE